MRGPGSTGRDVVTRRLEPEVTVPRDTVTACTALTVTASGQRPGPGDMAPRTGGRRRSGSDCPQHWTLQQGNRPEFRGNFRPE